MAMKARKISDNVWLLSRGKELYGFATRLEHQFRIQNKEEILFVDSLEEYASLYGEKLEEETTLVEKVKDIDGYPIRHDEVFNVEGRTYTKSEKSNTRYAAGYYVIETDGKHHGGFCPKVETIQDAVIEGPFKTKFEMQRALALKR